MPPPEAQPGRAERRVSSVELFWDLVFVFTITQVTTLLRSDLVWAGLGRAMLILALVWWAWSAYVWVINAREPDSTASLVVLLVSAVLIFISGLAVPGAFHGDGTLFAVTYAGARLLHLALYADASRRGRAGRPAIAGFGATVVIGMALLLAGSFAQGGLRIGLWAAAAAIDYAGPAWLNRDRMRGFQRVAVEHFSERYGQFIIICLGESVIGIGLGAQGRALGLGVIAAVALALVVTAEMWWAYFARFADVGQRRLAALGDPVLAAADAYSYLHLLLVGGVIVFAVGAREEVALANEAMPAPARLALCAGVALYLLGRRGVPRAADAHRRLARGGRGGRMPGRVRAHRRRSRLDPGGDAVGPDGRAVLLDAAARTAAAARGCGDVTGVFGAKPTGRLICPGGEGFPRDFSFWNR